MPTHTHQTAPTQFVEANGIRFAYRRFGKAGGVPLVFNQHFTGTMDHWDPAVTDGFAKDREVILFDNAGVSSSSGEVPTTIEDMAANAVAFTNALGLKTVDVLGFSIGGFVAQEMTLQAPNLVRRLVLLGTGPRGGRGMAARPCPRRRGRGRGARRHRQGPHRPQRSTEYLDDAVVDHGVDGYAGRHAARLARRPAASRGLLCA